MHSAIQGSVDAFLELLVRQEDLAHNSAGMKCQHLLQACMVHAQNLLCTTRDQVFTARVRVAIAAQSSVSRFAPGCTRTMQSKSAVLPAQAGHCCAFHCKERAGGGNICAGYRLTQALSRRRERNCISITMAAVAQQVNMTSRPVAAADQDIDIPDLRQLALRAILSLGFKQSDAACILEVISFRAHAELRCDLMF